MSRSWPGWDRGRWKYTGGMFSHRGAGLLQNTEAQRETSHVTSLESKCELCVFTQPTFGVPWWEILQVVTLRPQAAWLWGHPSSL